MGRQTQLLLLGLVAAVALYIFSKTQAGADVVASVADSVGNLVSGPRGIRNNNPGNIVRNSIQWQGALSQDQVAAAGLTWDSKFVQFDTPDNGVRAIGHILMSYTARGLSTPNEIIYGDTGTDGWSTTDQAAYAANIAAAVGVGVDDEIDVQSNLPVIATAIIQQENGQQPYDPNSIQAWVYS